MKFVMIIVSSIVISFLIVILSFKTNHYFYPDSGDQEYERSILGLVIEPISERNYQECVQYELGPKAVGHTKVLLSTCYLVFGCTAYENRANVFKCAA